MSEVQTTTADELEIPPPPVAATETEVSGEAEAEAEQTTEPEAPAPRKRTIKRMESDPKREATRETTPGEPKRREAPTKIEPGYLSPEMREVQRENDKSIKALIESFGGKAFKIRITRKDPDEIEDASGKWIRCGGFLKEVEHEIDEEWIAKRFGGGKYELEFKKPGPRGGFVYGGMVTCTIAGEPNIGELPRAVRREQQSAAGSSAAPGENPSIVKDVLGFMGKQVEQAQAQAREVSRGGPDDAVLGLLQKQLEASERRAEMFAREVRELRDNMSKPAPKTAEENVTQRMLDKLIDGDSARITALRAQYESEIRALNEARREDERRMQDRIERDIASLRQTHERELSSLRTSQEVALQAVRSSADVQVSSAKSAFDTQIALVKGELERLRAENAELRTEVKELRAKKDKSPIEMIKDMAALKEALGDDDDEPKGIGAQLAEAVANPATWEGIGSILQRAKPSEAQPQPPQLPQTRKRRVARVNGKKVLLEPDGTVTPIVEALPATPGEPVMPQLDPSVIANMVQLMEAAFEGNQDPALVAQSARSRVPEELLTAIRDHGVDAVMTKMAKLSSTSPLSSQRGRQWVRSLGEALVG